MQFEETAYNWSSKWHCTKIKFFFNDDLFGLFTFTKEMLDKKLHFLEQYNLSQNFGKLSGQDSCWTLIKSCRVSVKDFSSEVAVIFR